ncbi:MAG: tubulin/FtsZ family protein [Methanoregulaceae archaeon]|nr:tubulin/FtsZ family protein [Methanoregulaceae archaeon]
MMDELPFPSERGTNTTRYHRYVLGSSSITGEEAFNQNNMVRESTTDLIRTQSGLTGGQEGYRMQVVAIGLGGAGCRMVDVLYEKDRRFGSVTCLDAIAVDQDAGSLNNLIFIPENQKLFFPLLDPEHADDILENITIEEIIEKLQQLDKGDLDAILICLGLGGEMADAVPPLISFIRKAMIEPIFGLCTLPCLSEGSARSARAADDLDSFTPLFDGIILFDNEHLYPKVQAAARLQTVPVKKPLLPGFAKGRSTDSRPPGRYDGINELIAQRFGLLLRAGEFHQDRGPDIGEVVLDTGEVLNTMKGMGYISIGYAAEEVLPAAGFDVVRRFRIPGTRFEDSHNKAARMVQLARKAVHDEMSVQCDLASAQKALILIAGPNHEISMKGYMTVRKWIDRSIAGMEVRSGDYPLKNSRYVAVLILLAGITTIPRLDEIRQIRDQAKTV